MCCGQKRKMNSVLCVRAYVHACVCACACTHIPHTDHPTHPLTGILQFPCGCTEAVEDEVLHNRVDPLTTRGHHTHHRVTSTALVRLESVYRQSEGVDSRKNYWIYSTVGLTHTHYTLAYYIICTYINTITGPNFIWEGHKQT